jgi:hypothetical protein
VTPVDYAAEHVLTFDSIEVPAIGVPLPGFYVRANAAMVIGDITLSGESSSIQYVIMVVETNLDAGTITMETSIVHIQPDNEYTGAFTNGTGTLTVNGKIVKEGFAVGDDEGGDENNLLTTGDIVQPAVGVVTNLIYDGSAILAGEINADTVVINGEVYFVGGMDISEIQNLEVKGKMVVEDGINVITEYLDVKGDVEVQGGGFLHTEVMLVGVDKNGKSTIDSVPVVTGNILVYDYVLFAPDCVIPEYIAKDAGLRSTVFYGEGNKKIATAYAVPSTEAQNKNIKIVVENAWLNGWMEKNGMIVDDAIYGEYPEVFASIDYYIYHVTIVADYGVQNVAIDGVILPHGNISNNTYFIDLKTGIHTVTVTLASGYIGTAKLYIIQDEKPVELTASKFTAVGTPTTADGFFYELQVAGAEANTGDVIIHVDPSDPMVVIDKESNEWSVYTILMLVLVIVVGLVAVVLALRLHRS